LKACDGCKSIQYCSDTCQTDHRPQHERECNERAAELRDEILFKQPESSHWGDCPICFLPLPQDPKHFGLMECCGKMICRGCIYANISRETKDKIECKCPFCRHPFSEDADRNKKKRIEAKNDPATLREVGKTRYNDGDYKSAFKYWTKAAELGDIVAHFTLSMMYRKGEGVETDEKMALHHLEVAAIGGHPRARQELGCGEKRNGRLDRAVKHWTIAAKLGNDNSLNALKWGYKEGYVSKEDFAAALRAHQAAVDATKSTQREAAEALNLN